ncbi:hypothetical protein ACFV6E_41490 [Streptomyces sp. NPDC059785]|uniref:hypothetical protein n=1 Tax=Streptomyces sp. NPDC059785 TaxID=3346945 RepID=UPI00365E8150
MTDDAGAAPGRDGDRRVVDRLVPVWLAEAAEHEPRAARKTGDDWEHGRLTPDAAGELADWVTARVTDTGFNEDEGPVRDGPARVTVADKEAVHRWLAAQGHDV